MNQPEADAIPPRRDPRLRGYLADVQAWHGYVRFLGLPTLQDHPDTPMHELFVPPLLSKTFVSQEMDMAHWPKSAAVLPTLHEARRLVVLGDPGGGKTTLINWLAWLLVSGVEERVPDWLSGCIPLPFVLREMELAGVDSFDRLLDAFLKRPVAAQLRGQKDLLLELLAAGRVLVLADGLDEVGSRQREGVRDAIRDGLSVYYNSYFLVTSRIIGYEDCPVDNLYLWNAGTYIKPDIVLACEAIKAGMERYKTIAQDSLASISQKITLSKEKINSILSAYNTIQHYHIIPFDDDRIRAFAVNWYRLRSQKPTADSDAEQFIKALFRDETTLRLARNPQLLTLMALVFRVRAHLPDGRALLYDLIAEAYLESIDKARHISTSAADAAPWREKRRWLARVGFEMQYRRTAALPSPRGRGQGEGEANRELLTSRTEVLGWLAAAMDESGYSANPGFVDDYLNWVARRSGLLLPRGKDHDEDQFAFVHLSFQEYFAAIYLCEYLADADWVLAQRNSENGSENTAVEGDSRVCATALRDWAKDPRWQETLVFCFEAFAHQPKDSKRLVTWLFGEDCQDFLETLKPPKRFPIKPIGARESPQTELLSRLLINPHVGLKPMEREAVFAAIWQYLAKTENRFTRFMPYINPKVLNRVLASGDRADRFFQKLRELQPFFLNLNQTNISDFSFLHSLTSLQRLYLGQTSIDDLSPLAGLLGLQVCTLNKTPVSDLSPLAGLTGLQTLFLSLTVVSDLSPLAGLNSLQMLFLDESAVSDLSALAGLTSLQVLKLGQTAVSDLSPLAGLTSLQVLKLGQTAVSDLSPLAGLTSLKGLDLSQTAVTDLSPLIHLPNLKKLRIDSVKAPIPPLCWNAKACIFLAHKPSRRAAKPCHLSLSS